MTSGGNPFAWPAGDPFASQDAAPEDAGPPTSYGGAPVDVFHNVHNGAPQTGRAPAGPRRRAPGRNLEPVNAYAILALVLGVLAPPAGVALGHLALPQIKRTGERGWLAAVCGLVLGYVLSAVLIAVLLWLFAFGGDGAGRVRVMPPAALAPSPSVVTSIAPAPTRPRHKLDLNQATIGKCVEIEKRDTAPDLDRDDALDLFEVPCEHRVGVYTVVARVSADQDCSSTYVAAPPDRSFAVCLNRY